MSIENCSYRVAQCVFAGAELPMALDFVDHFTTNARMAVLRAQENPEITPSMEGKLEVHLRTLDGGCVTRRFEAVLCSKTFRGKQDELHHIAYRFKILRECA